MARNVAEFFKSVSPKWHDGGEALFYEFPNGGYLMVTDSSGIHAPTTLDELLQIGFYPTNRKDEAAWYLTMRLDAAAGEKILAGIILACMGAK